MQIKADGIANLYNPGYAYKAWWTFGDGDYQWSRKTFKTPQQALQYGKRVAERYNRIFGKETVKDE